MRNIKIADKSIRKSAERSDYSLSFKEKIELARLLDKLRVDVIELPMITETKKDTLLIKTIAGTVKHAVVSCVAGVNVESINRTYEAIKLAANKRLNIVLPTSAVQMEYQCGKKPKKMIELIDELVRTAANLCEDVEFTAVDASRSEREFLIEAVKTAVNAGAKTITFADTAGTMIPDEIKELIMSVKQALPELEDITISVECSNELNMANANLFAATAAGAMQIKTTIQGVDSPALEEVVHMFAIKGDACDVSCNVKTVKLQRNIRQIAWDGNKENKITPFDETDKDKKAINLDENTDIATINRIVTELGYELSEEDSANVYEEFKRVAEKKEVGEKELEFIIATATLQAKPTYKLVDFVINSGNIITPTANITLEKDGHRLRGLSTGDGPIEAALLAIENIIGHHYELDDFQIQSVTRGSEAVGAALVKLRSEGKLYSGNGISTDIIGASIRAYINALNKIVSEGDE